jgi:molybdate transport system ATP-binding protein
VSALEADFVRRFPNGPAIHGRLSVPAGAGATVLFGPSGSGKTTVLRCLAGLERPDAGTIRFSGETWADSLARVWVPPQLRGAGYLSQDYALFPHLTVGGNVAYGLGDFRRSDRRQRVAEMLTLFGLAGLEGRYPAQLSGGQQQRVALARALARRPRLLLLDEPLSALDAPTRGEVRRELRRLLAGLGVPALVVTHDRLEALALGDAVAVLIQGEVRQCGSVAEVFARPATLEVARAVGVETVEPGVVLQVAGDVAIVEVGRARLKARAPGATPGKVYVCVRGEDVDLEAAPGGSGEGDNRLGGVVRTLDREGPMVRVGLDCGCCGSGQENPALPCWRRVPFASSRTVSESGSRRHSSGTRSLRRRRGTDSVACFGPIVRLLGRATIGGVPRPPTGSGWPSHSPITGQSALPRGGRRWPWSSGLR